MFLAIVGTILAIDLEVFHRKEHVVSFKEATIWGIIFVVLALIFNFGLYQYSLQRFDEATA